MFENLLKKSRVVFKISFSLLLLSCLFTFDSCLFWTFEWISAVCLQMFISDVVYHIFNHCGNKIGERPDVDNLFCFPLRKISTFGEKPTKKVLWAETIIWYRTLMSQFVNQALYRIYDLIAWRAGENACWWFMFGICADHPIFSGPTLTRGHMHSS